MTEAQKKPSTGCGDGFRTERRAWDSNPPPLAGHLISSQAAGQFAYPPKCLQSSTLTDHWQVRIALRDNRKSTHKNGKAGRTACHLLLLRRRGVELGERALAIG